MMLKGQTTGTRMMKGGAALLWVESTGVSFGFRPYPSTPSLQLNMNLTGVNIGSSCSVEHQQFSDNKRRQS
jgi:hypothetical protein